MPRNLNEIVRSWIRLLNCSDLEGEVEQHITIMPNPAARRGSIANYAFPELHPKVNRKYKFAYFSFTSVPHLLSHRENVRTSKFWQKSKEKNQTIFRIFTKVIQGFNLEQKISYLCNFKGVFKRLSWVPKRKWQKSLAGTGKTQRKYLGRNVL